MTDVIKMAAGNIGAAMFLFRLTNEPENDVYEGPVLARLNGLPSLRGDALAALFQNLANNQVPVLAHILDKAPAEVLEAACNADTETGRRLITPYLPQGFEYGPAGYGFPGGGRSGL